LRGSEKSAGAFVEWVLRVAILRFFNVPPEGSKTDAVNTWVNRTLKEGGRMPSLVSATFEVKDWVETPLDEVEMPKVTRAVVAKTYSGDIDGTSMTEWLMSSAEDGSATFVGMERISGSGGGTGRELRSETRRKVRRWCCRWSTHRGSKVREPTR